MKEKRVPFDSILLQQQNQIRAIYAGAGGNLAEKIVAIVIITEPFDQELLRSLPSVSTVDDGGDCPDQRPEDASELPPLAPRVRIQR